MRRRKRCCGFPFCIFFNLENNSFDFLTDGEDFGRVLDVLGPGHFRNVDETFNTAVEFDECTVISDGNNLTLNDSAFRITFGDILPRMRLKLLHAERDAFLLVVEVEDHDFDFLTELEHFGRVVDALVAHVGDVEEAIYAAKVDECTEVGDVLDDTLADLVLLESFENVATLLVAFFFENNTARNDDVATSLVDLDNLEVEFLADKSVDVRNLTEVDLRAREEGIDTKEVDDNAALDALRESAAYDFVVFECSVDAIPHANEVSLLLGEDEATVFVFELFDEHFDFGTEFERISILEFGAINNAFGLVVHVDENFLVVHLADLTRDELALFEAAHAGIDVSVSLAEVRGAFTLSGENFFEIFLSSEFEILRHIS